MHRPVAAILALLWIPVAFAAQTTNYVIPSDVTAVGGGEESTSNNYVLSDTIGEIGAGPGRSTNYSLDAGYRQAEQVSYSISITGDTVVSIGSIAGDGVTTGSGSWSVTTNNPAGYSLAWKASAVSMTSGPNTIDPYSPASPNVPDTWSVAASAAEWGARLSSRSTDTAAEWGTDGASEKWLNVATADRTLVTRNTASPSGSTQIIQFRTEIGSSTIVPSGVYSVTITLTATML